MRNIFITYAILIAIFFAFSCKTTKIATEKKKDILTIDKIYDSLTGADPVYRNLEIKFTINYQTEKKEIDLKGTLKIAKDSLIWISLTPGLGIEGARFMCNKDSLFILDRLNKTYRKSDYNYIKENWKVDIDYTILQSLLVSKLFIYPNVSDTRNDFISTFSIQNVSDILKIYRKNSENVENILNVDRNIYKIKDYLINEGNAQRSLYFLYTYEKLNEGYHFPKTISVKSFSAGKSLNIDLDYTKIQVNTNLNFPFSVPSSYTKIGK
jgi:hypothetical protein